MTKKERARKVSRRSFLKLAGGATLAGATLGLSGYSDFVRSANAAGTAEDASDSGMSKSVLVDIPKCVGCKSCSAACMLANNLEPNEKVRAMTAEERAEDPGKGLASNVWTAVCLYEPESLGTDNSEANKRFVKTQCFHCMEPACASACFAKALQKTPEGPVVYKQNLCVGCRYCMLACPFDIIKYEWEQAIPGISKCQMCSERVAAGQNPACVDSCPNGALEFGTRSEMLALAKSRINDTAGDITYSDHIFGETEAGGTSWLYIADAPFAEMRFRTDVTKEPLPSYTDSYMKMTPIVGVSWAAILAGLLIFRNRDKKSHD